MLVASKELVTAARAGGYAVGAFNAVNMESAQAIFGAAEETRSPFIIQITQTTLGYTEPDELFAMIAAVGKRATVPFAIHLDHGRGFEVCMRFLRLGVTSLMIDGSLQEDGKSPRSYEENVEVTRRVAAAAHAMGVTVEAEIGRLGQIMTEAEAADHLTDPEEAARFVKDTGVDMLAVAIGTTHGLFKGRPRIAHDRLREVAAAVPVPLVMHGGTGVPDEDVRKGVSLGIAKVNIDTQIRVAFYDTVIEQVHQIEKTFAEADAAGGVRKYDIRKVLAPAREAMREAVMGRMTVFGSAGKAG
jgi:fructose-bisphosphate aldolase class II